MDLEEMLLEWNLFKGKPGYMQSKKLLVRAKRITFAQVTDGQESLCHETGYRFAVARPRHKKLRANN